jgi:serine/threonine-protein kinase
VIGPGTTLARYRVESKLGEGGMGVVWKATDTSLGRAVALKLLPEAFARDPERVARFEREARMLAALNHPNIAAIYGLESAGDLRFLAMEFVPGQTLSERLAGGALPVPETIAIAQRIAEALESAHERGVVHRDLKPSNIQITPDGDVKLLDFGLARAFAPDGEIASRTDESPTISAVMTRGDVILGTAAYMSPEQARGRLVDRRSDIWSFGLVVFEMLTGRQVFDGDTTSDLLAAVLRQDIPWERLPEATPPHLRALLERCLERDPKERLRDIGEARIALARAPAAHAHAAAAPRPRGSLVRWGIPALAIVLAAGLAWFLARRTAPRETGEGAHVFEIASVSDPKNSRPAVSPDGESVAYVDQGQLWVRGLNQLEPRSLVADPEARKPFWSPDSRTIGFLSGTSLMRIPATGGDAERIADFPAAFGLGGEGAAWDDQGRVIVTQGLPSGLVEVPERGGESRTFFAPDTARENDFHDPAFLPGGRGVLVVGHRKPGPNNISLLRQGKLTPLLVLPDQFLSRPQYSPTGHIVFERSTPPVGVWAVPFSLASLRTTGEPFLVVPGGLAPTVARDGSLVYVSRPTQPLEFCWVDRSGAVVQHLGTVGEFGEDGAIFDLSPDDTRAVITQGAGVDLWIYDFARGARTPLTNRRGLEVNPVWTPDGRQLIYQAFPGNKAPNLSDWAVVRQSADGTGTPDTLARGGMVTPGISKDGRTLFYSHITSSSGWTLESRSLDAPGSPVARTDGQHVAYSPRPSPDGQRVVYCRNDFVPNGRPQVVLQSLATGTQTVIGTGLWPKWSASGDRIYFVQRDDLMEVKVGPGDSPVTGPPTRLFTRPHAEVALVFDWTPEFGVRGDRFLILRPLDQTRATSIVLAQNWLAEFAKPKR